MGKIDIDYQVRRLYTGTGTRRMGVGRGIARTFIRVAVDAVGLGAVVAVTIFSTKNSVVQTRETEPWLLRNAM